MSGANAVTLTPLGAAQLPALAAALAPLPLFVRYGLDAAALRARWEATLAAPDGRLLGLSAGGAPLGLACFAVAGTFGGGAYLRQLALVPAAQGRGHGARLLAGFEAAAAAAPGGYFLLASQCNAGARRFYGAHGYRDVGALPGFARPGIVERIMWKPPPA